MHGLKLKESFEVEVEVTPPFNFDLTVNKYTLFGTEWYLMSPFEVYMKGNLWTALMLNDEKPIGFHLKAAKTSKRPKIVVKVFSSEKLSQSEKEEILEILLFSLGLERSPEAFYEFAEKYEALTRAVSSLYGMRLTSPPDLFSSVILALTLQRASYGRTERMIRALYQNYGFHAEFSNVKVIVRPSARTIAKIAEENIRRTCKLGYRAPYLKYNADIIAREKTLSLRELANLPSLEDAKLKLRKMKGIGEYSSEVILFAFYPCFPVDSWSAEIFAKIFKTENSVKAVKDYAKKNFKEWQNYVYDYVINYCELQQ